jgi:hypothetical protein
VLAISATHTQAFSGMSPQLKTTFFSENSNLVFNKFILKRVIKDVKRLALLIQGMKCQNA